jgi:hypothetical protein
MDIGRIPFPLRTSEAVLAAISDWLVFALILGTIAEQHWVIAFAGSGLAFVTCWLIEGESGEGFTRPRITRALAAALIVAVPTPVLGTLTALAALRWDWVQDALARRLH